MSAQSAPPKQAGPDRQEVDRVIIRFAGDSGDGMQLTGERFTSVSAVFGNDLATMPDFPAEIRAPAGTLAGVSAFQIHFADYDILTPGDQPGVLVAMNPAALKANIKDLAPGGLLIVNTDAFEERNLDKVGYTTNPLEDDSLSNYQVYKIPMTSMTVDAVKEAGVTKKEAERSKNMLALGVLSWMYGRPLETTIGWLEKKFAKKPALAQANIAALKAGHAFGETAELTAFEVKPAILAPGKYRRITGNQALAYGLIAAGVQAKLPLFLASYPITPASDVLHELSRHKNFGVRTIQAEDEIAAAGMALGAAFSGHLGVTTTSGPGLDLKSETIGLAISLELPMIVVDVQRGGPSTGLPTKTEQSDLLHAMFGRHGEAPLPIVAAYTPASCFWAAIEAARLAVKYMTPVILLTDGYLANSAEPWRIPTVDKLPNIAVRFASQPNAGEDFWPYLRDDQTLARPWAIPGTAGLEHRVGGIEKADGTGNISYDPDNHQLMTELRQAKIKAIEEDIDPLEFDADEGATVLILGWGGTYGQIGAAVRRIRARGKKVARAHLKHLNPFPKNTGEVLSRFEHVVIPEMNMGQLARLIRAEFLIDAISIKKVKGVPFKAAEIEERVMELL
ncbi:MAG: 2-oxoglutarate/2-oxoacid ferredoxin oxidoreductase subunit alpha [Actinomycetota bacterium]|jgi:2-oxoglutarate ferredoxin oxidoreductase subunit alpha|nr:2-oxoglutarate/2-oxoacid ferredoxin oxidoreductase subunit alpha [Actinomycetota bacterium]